MRPSLLFWLRVSCFPGVNIPQIAWSLWFFVRVLKSGFWQFPSVFVAPLFSPTLLNPCPLNVVTDVVGSHLPFCSVSLCHFFLSALPLRPSFVVNSYFSSGLFKFLCLVFYYILFVFLVVALGIKICVLIYHNLLQVNSDLILRKLTLFQHCSISSSLVCVVVVIYTTSFYIWSPAKQFIIMILCDCPLNLLSDEDRQNIFVQCFIFTFIITLTDVLHFFLWLLLTICCHFLSAWRTSLVLVQTRLLSVNSVSLCLVMSLFQLQFFLKCNFAGYRINAWLTVFVFQTLNMSFYSFLVSVVSDEKWAVNLIVVALYLMSPFSLGAFQSLFFNRLTVFCWASLILDLCFFIKFGGFSAILSISVLFYFLSLLPFWDSHFLTVNTIDVVPQVSAAPFVFFFSLFFLYFSEWILSIAISSSSLILLPSQICCWAYIVNSLFCYFALQL